MLVPLTYVNVSFVDLVTYQNTILGIPTSLYLLVDCTRCVKYRGGGRHCFRIINLTRAISQYWQQDVILMLPCFTFQSLDVVVSKVKRFIFHSRSRVLEGERTFDLSSTTTFWCDNVYREWGTHVVTWVMNQLPQKCTTRN